MLRLRLIVVALPILILLIDGECHRIVHPDPSYGEFKPKRRLYHGTLSWHGYKFLIFPAAEDESNIHLHPKTEYEIKWSQTHEFEDKTHWYNLATNSITKKLKEPMIKAKAKNLIMFLGDGLSVSTITASRIYKGQLQGLKYGEEGQLYMDTFPIIGTSKTYCSDWQVADSACSATAYLCGTKANAKTMGVSPDVTYNNCTLQMNPEHHVSSILAWSQLAGKSTGIVTSTTVTHASPGAAFAHIANRDWENNKKIEDSGWNSDECDDIAEQLVTKEPGININVILGGGREHFLNEDINDPENPSMSGGVRTDSKNLIEEWQTRHRNDRAKYIYKRADLLAESTVNDNDFLLGLFSNNSIGYADEQEMFDDPSLAEMTKVAIQILSKNPNGFFLFVEGGRIDHAHHANFAKRAIGETIQFDDAIKLADDLTKDEETLIVVTSDHSHLFTIAGDPLRGNPILGFSGNENNLDGPLPYTTLAYINGQGYRKAEFDSNTGECVRANIANDPINNYDYRFVSQVPRKSATHAGEDVLIYAKGPWSHLFTGTNDQSYIPHAMAFAGCVNPFGYNSCDGYNANSGHCLIFGSINKFLLVIIMFVAHFYII